VQNFRDLKVWEKAHQLALGVYRGTASFPREEQYGLTSQMRRASFSVPANIAEGCGRGSAAQLRSFLEIGMGSASELEYYLILARDLGYLPVEQYTHLDAGVREVKRMLASLIAKVGNG
jgi:four helix bundle protein